MVKVKKINFDPTTLTWNSENYRVDRNEAARNPFIALKKLIGGNRRFVEGKSIRPRQDLETVRQLGSGQFPFSTIVSCSDSRVPNEIIFDQGVGDLFIVRTAGQVPSVASYGSMEFAATTLHTKLIVVLGHTKCGAVAAAVQRPKDISGHIVTLINEIKPAVEKCLGQAGDLIENASKQNVIDQVAKLRALEPILNQMFLRGDVLIVGAIYDLETGQVEFLKETLENLPLK